MDLVAPLGPVYQAGTLSGNPLAMAAGLATAATVAQITRKEIYPHWTSLAPNLRREWPLPQGRGHSDLLQPRGIDVYLVLPEGPVTDWDSAVEVGYRSLRADSFARCSIVEFILPPSQYEAAFLERRTRRKMCSGRWRRRSRRLRRAQVSAAVAGVSAAPSFCGLVFLGSEC